MLMPERAEMEASYSDMYVLDVNYFYQIPTNLQYPLLTSWADYLSNTTLENNNQYVISK